MDRTGNHVLSMARLAKDVLAEIPDQLISYMKSRGIKPSPVPPVNSTISQPQNNPVWAPWHTYKHTYTHTDTHTDTRTHTKVAAGSGEVFLGGTPFWSRRGKRWSGWLDSPLLPGKLEPLWEKLTSSGGVQRWATPRRRWGRQSFSRLPSNLSKCWCKRIASENPVGRDPCLRRKYIRMCQCVSCLWYLSELMCVELGKSCVL